jgi:hypothetical protein
VNVFALLRAEVIYVTVAAPLPHRLLMLMAPDGIPANPLTPASPKLIVAVGAFASSGLT